MGVGALGILFVLSILLVLISGFFFSNTMEWLKKRFELSEAIIGTILSIIGASFPQIVIPLIALTFLKGIETTEIGIGAIIGAPFVLSTLGFGIIGYTVITLAKKNIRSIEVDADFIIISRDLKFFLITYSFAIFAAFLGDKFPQVFIGFILLVVYGYYIYRNVVYEERIPTELHTHLYFAQQGKEPSLEIILFQLISSLTGLIGGACLFVHTMREISIITGDSQAPLIGLILSIILTPIVIELPLRINIFSWLREGRDTLVLSDVISSMIFQACILVMIGILFSPWKLEGIKLLVGCIPILATTILYITMIIQEKINPYVLLGSSGFYLIFIIALFFI